MGESEQYLLLPVDESEGPVMVKTVAGRRFGYLAGTFLNLILFIVSVGSLATTGVVIHRYGGFQNCDGNLLTQTTFNSPAAKELRANWSTVLLQSSHLDNLESIYRQPPGDAVDSAWETLARNPPFITLSADEVRGLGKDPAEAARPPTDWGLGPDVYLGTIDAYHQLHCLDMLRTNLRDNFNHYHSTPLSPLARAHVSHCLEALMKTLMCQPSLDVLTAVWTEGIGGLGPAHLADFDFNRKCWDCSQLDRWVQGRRVDITEEMMANLTPPPGTRFQPPPIEVKEALAGMWGD